MERGNGFVQWDSSRLTCRHTERPHSIIIFHVLPTIGKFKRKGNRIEWWWNDIKEYWTII